jgi:hypothetical protein
LAVGAWHIIKPPSVCRVAPVPAYADKLRVDLNIDNASR